MADAKMVDSNLRYEIRDDVGNIICATHDLSIAEKIAPMLGKRTIVDLNSAVSHVAWYQCDFSKYFSVNPSAEVTVCGTIFRQKKDDVEVADYEY